MVSLEPRLTAEATLIVGENHTAYYRCDYQKDPSPLSGSLRRMDSFLS
jgi:hypothetical protein